jgi:hypothetical protein
MSFDPQIGKWLQEDPDGFSAGDPNLTRYVGNDPVNETDPTGQFAESDDAQKKVDIALDNLLKKSTKAKEIYEKAKKAVGGTIHVKAGTAVAAEGWWDPEKNTVFLNPKIGNKTEERMQSTILIELLNASRDLDFKVIDQAASFGGLSRIDYVVSVENIEFQNTKKHHEIAEGLKWGTKKGEGGDSYAGVGTFDAYVREQIRVGHSKDYGTRWNMKFARAWKKEHDKDDPNVPLKDLTKKLEKDTIEGLQKVLQGK